MQNGTVSLENMCYKRMGVCFSLKTGFDFIYIQYMCFRSSVSWPIEIGCAVMGDRTQQIKELGILYVAVKGAVKALDRTNK